MAKKPLVVDAAFSILWIVISILAGKTDMLEATKSWSTPPSGSRSSLLERTGFVVERTEFRGNAHGIVVAIFVDIAEFHRVLHS